MAVLGLMASRAVVFWVRLASERRRAKLEASSGEPPGRQAAFATSSPREGLGLEGEHLPGQ